MKKRVRNGVTRLIIDFHYPNEVGERVRFVRHAELQTRDAAEKEAARYHERAVLTGAPELEIGNTMTLSTFYESVFRPKVLPVYRKNTRIRHEALWRQRVERAFSVTAGLRRCHFQRRRRGPGSREQTPSTRCLARLGAKLSCCTEGGSRAKPRSLAERSAKRSEADP